MPLTVSTDIPYGNACDISIVEAGRTRVVTFAADPHGGPEALWFCFRLAGGGGGRRKVKLVLKHFQNMLGGNEPETFRPVASRPDGDWERMPAGTVESTGDGRFNLSWMIDEPAPSVDVALCYPYGRPEVHALLADTDGCYEEHTIGASQAARPLVRLSNSFGEHGGSRPGLYLIARQHSGETPGSWMLDGFLRYMATLGDRAPLVWSVPLSNVDGVEEGSYGKDNFPYDLNRAWGSPPMRHETSVIRRDMRRWKERCRPALALDFHAPGACEADGAYCYLGKPGTAQESSPGVRRWAAVLAKALGAQYASKEFARVTDYASRWETPTFAEFCVDALDVDALSLEMPYGLCANGLLLTRERYREAGARLAAGVAEALQPGRPRVRRKVTPN